MKRITHFFLIFILAACVSVAAFAGGGGESGTKAESIKYSTPVAPDHAHNLAANQFAENVAKDSGGRLKVEVFPANQLGETKDVIEFVMTGSVHMFISGTAETALFQPEWGVMDCPYLLRDFDHLMKVGKSSAIQEIIEKMDASRGVRVLRADMYYGTRHLTTLKKEIKTPADLNGMLIRAPDQSIYLAAVRAMGATPTPVAFGDLYMALKQGVVDGQENPIPTIYTYKYYEAQKYLMLTGHMVRTNVIGAASAWYKGLPQDLRNIIDKALDASVEFANKLTIQQETEMLDELKELGMIIVQPDVAAFRAAAKDVPKEFESVWGKGLAERIAAIR
jgi:tripartite ATP-independent transporter DctP family solute receptor